jgi:small subunit ribosomal protein S6
LVECVFRDLKWFSPWRYGKISPIYPEGGAIKVEKRTALYETTFVVNTALGEEAVKALVEKFTALINENAKVEKIDEWGNRKLAYPIDDYTEGYYVYVKYSSETAFPAELKRILNITDGILRSLTIKCEE